MAGRSIARIPHDEGLKFLFNDADRALGARSGFGAFVDLAMSGVQPGGRSDYETAITDRRLHDAGHAADLRARFFSLPRGQRDVLWACYGPHGWEKTLDAEIGGRDVRVKVLLALGDLLGVALLTQAARDGHEARLAKLRIASEPVAMRLSAPAREKAIRAAKQAHDALLRAEQGGVARYVLDAAKGGGAPLAALEEESFALLRPALRAWWNTAPKRATK